MTQIDNIWWVIMLLWCQHTENGKTEVRWLEDSQKTDSFCCIYPQKWEHFWTVGCDDLHRSLLLF